MSAVNGPVPPASWDDLVAAALLGTGRGAANLDRLPPTLAQALSRVPVPEAGDPAGRLLDAGALATVYRRAGMRPVRAPAAPPPPPEEHGRAASPQAQQRLAGLLTDNDTELITVWLTTAAQRQLLPEPQLLPALLDAATRNRSLAEAVGSAVGERGRWLAGQREDWARALRSRPAQPGPSVPDPGAPAPSDGTQAGAEPGEDDVWRLGTPEQRLAWLADLRRRDPDAARGVLLAGWSAEAPDQRAGLLQVLGEGLSAADEEFLQRCLTERRAQTRAVAADLLRRLPASAFAARASARALTAVRRERQLLRSRLVVDPPRHHDPELAADQIPAPPAATSVGEGGPVAWLLRHVVAAAPLRTWVPALAATPAELVGLDVADGWRPVLWQGWAVAAVREGDPQWAAALLSASVPQAPDAHAAVAQLIGLLTPADRARLVPRLLGDPNVSLIPVLQDVAVPWPAPVADAVLAWLSRQTGHRPYDVEVVLGLAGRGLPVDRAEALAATAHRWPPDHPVHRRALAAAARVTIRRDLLQELQ